MVVFTRWACFAGLLAGAVEGKVEWKNPGNYHWQNLGPGSVSGIKASSAPSSIAKPVSSSSFSIPTRPSSTEAASVSSARKSRGSSASVSRLGPLTTSSADTCSGKTLNVLQASLDWWYPQTYTYIASTFVVQHDAAGSATGWILEPAATPFDVTSAVNSLKCPPLSDGPSKTCTRTPPPTAASTTVVTQTAYSPLAATTGTGSVPYLAVTPPPAAITIPASGGNFSAGTPFVFFSAYEILTKSPTTYAGADHSVGCVTATTTYQMTAPFSFEYTGEDPDGQVLVNAGVTGDVNPAFLGVVNVTSVLAGSWVAAPTVAVVVSKVVAVSQSFLATPTPTLPSGLTSNAASPAGTLTPGQPNIEASALSLQLPTYPSSVSDATAQQQSSASSVFPFSPSSTSSSPSLIASPTNALDVLSNALATFPTNALDVLSAAEATFTSSPASTGSGGGASVPNKAVTVPVMTFAGRTMTANAASDFVIPAGDGSSATLVPGAPALTISGGTTISLAPGGSVVVVNGVTQTLSRSATVAAAAATAATYSPISGGGGASIPAGAAGPSLVAPGSGGKASNMPAPATGGAAVMQRVRGVDAGSFGYGLTGLLGVLSFGFAVLL